MTDARRTFRIIDMIVVVIVVYFLMMLVVMMIEPWNGGHNHNRRSQCQNNLRQVALGLIQFQMAKGAFPNSGTFDDDPSRHGGDPLASSIYRAVVAPASFKNDPSPLLRSWVVDISPYIDQQELYNSWDHKQSYLSSVSNTKNIVNNYSVASTSISILRCPDDPTTVPGAGNLSYAVNGGFARWYAVPVGWAGGGKDGGPANGGVLRWTPEGSPWKGAVDVGRKLGVMFPGTKRGDQPWDVRTTPNDLVDGAATTLMVGENVLVGASPGTPYSGGLPTNWACPFPNFTTFLGSDDVCRSKASEVDCLAGQLAPTAGRTIGPGWKRANERESFERINGGASLTVEGSFPFLNSRHPGGSNVAFCDGSVRFLSETIDGAAYAEIITPAGSTLPKALRQPARAIGPDDW